MLQGYENKIGKWAVSTKGTEWLMTIQLVSSPLRSNYTEELHHSVIMQQQNRP
jgi:hypothetical protein